MPNDTSPENVLSSAFLSKLMLASLPRSTSSPQLQSPLDVIALAACSVLIALEFELVAVGEAPPLDDPSIAQAPQPLPSDWNSDWDANKRVFHFRDADSRERFELYVVPTDQQAITVTGVAVDNNDKREKFRTTVEWDEFVSRGSLPLDLNSKTYNGDDRRKVESVFLTAGRLSDFGKQIRKDIIQKHRTAQRTRAEGGSSSTTAAEEKSNNPQSSQSGSREPSSSEPPSTFDREENRPGPRLIDQTSDPSPALPNINPYADPLNPPPQQQQQPRRSRFPEGDVQPPDFEDEHRLLQGNRGPALGLRQPQRPMAGYGDRDRLPGFDPLAGGVGGNGGGGMFFPGPGQAGSRPPWGIRHDPVNPMGGGHPRGAGMGGMGPMGSQGDPFGEEEYVDPTMRGNPMMGGGRGGGMGGRGWPGFGGGMGGPPGMGGMGGGGPGGFGGGGFM